MKSRKFVKIYRVENIRGEGPFINVSHAMDGSHPTPHADPGFDKEKLESFLPYHGHPNKLFGCRSRHLMKNWIAYPKLLKQEGFVVRKYLVKPQAVIKGKYQSIYDKTSAKMVKEFCPTEFCKGN